MPKEVKITKDMIIDAAFQIAKSDGLDKVSNREIALRLNCSIRPIYYQFKNVEELNKELYFKVEKYFYKYLMDNMREDIPKYKQVGINYIKFAKEEKKLFQMLFMTKTEYLPDEFVSSAGNDYMHLKDIIRLSTDLKDEDIKKFHIKMWIFTHGIASLVASDTVQFSDKQIQELLSHEFQALMLLEENPDNKWVLKTNEKNSNC